MAKAKLITRQETTTTVTSDNFNKGSELSFAEADSNFLNLRDTTFGVTADDSATIQIGMDDALYIRGGTNCTTSTNSDGTITINATGSGSTGDLTISTSVVNGEDTVRLEVPGSHDLELNAGTGGGPGGDAPDRFIQVKDHINFHGRLNSDGSNGDIHLTPNGTGVIAFYTGATAGYTFPRADASAGGKVLVLSGHDGSSVKTLSFSNIPTFASADIGGINISTDNVISTAGDDSTTLTITTQGSGNMNLSAETITMSSSVHIGLGGDSAGGLIIEDNTIATARSNENLELDASGTGGIELLTQVVRMANLPTSDPSSAGQLWNDSNTLKVSAG